MDVTIIRREQIDSAVVSILKSKKKTLITGLAGSGKTFMADKIKEKGGKIQHLDWIASKVNGQWIVNLTKIDNSIQIFEGVCDNLEQVISIIKPELVYIIEANSEELRISSKLRSQEKDNLFKKHFSERAVAPDEYWVQEKKNFRNLIRIN